MFAYVFIFLFVVVWLTSILNKAGKIKKSIYLGKQDYLICILLKNTEDSKSGSSCLVDEPFG